MKQNSSFESTQLSLFKIDYSDTPYKIRMVSRMLGLSGQNVEFLNEDFFGLKVGEKVLQIGNGKENGTIRTDIFNYPVEYTGAIILQFNTLEKMYAFKLPDKIDDDDIFLLYGNAGEEIFTEKVDSMKDRQTKKPSSYVRFFAPVFERANVNV